MSSGKNTWKIKTVKYVILISSLVLHGINTTAGIVANQATPPGQSLPLTRKLSEVDLIYYEDFPYFESHHYQPTPECILLREETKNRQTGHSHILRCTEHINLLLPVAEVNSWGKEQEQQGYVNLHTKAITADYVGSDIHAHIILVKPAIVTAEKFSPSADAHPATVLFIRHARNIRTYQFKNLITGAISTINSTDNHPFYSVDKQAFIPIASASDSDRMVTETGQPVKLICSKKSKKHCGIPYKNGQLTTVYNMETYPKHTYFAGKENHILVHNCSMKPSSGAQLSHPDRDTQWTANATANSHKAVYDTEQRGSRNIQVMLEADTPNRKENQDIEDEIYYSLAEIKTWEHEADKTRASYTQGKILYLKDAYGNQATLDELLTGAVEQNDEGRFTALPHYSYGPRHSSLPTMPPNTPESAPLPDASSTNIADQAACLLRPLDEPSSPIPNLPPPLIPTQAPLNK